jgi:hypothetical protein
MASDVKHMASAIFGISGQIFIEDDSRYENPLCRALLLGPNDTTYTKFAPVLFHDPNNCNTDDFLKSAILVRVRFLKQH